MKKIVLTCGLIAGAIVAVIMVITMAAYHKNQDYGNGMLIGYGSMVLAFSMIYVGIKSYRDKYNNGVVSFGKAFKIGLYISLIASTVYVVVWLFDYYLSMPDFMERYSEYTLNQLKADGASATEISETTQEMEGYKEMYKNPLFVVLFTYFEILPVGLLVSLICAAILKRKNNANAAYA